MTYRPTARAEADIDSIADHISDDNPPAAVRLIRDFVRRWELLATLPSSGAPSDDVQPGLRRVIVGQYIAFYAVDDGEVVILRVLHGRRDIIAEGVGG